jgi:hypothetical protein
MDFDSRDREATVCLTGRSRIAFLDSSDAGHTLVYLINLDARLC